MVLSARRLGLVALCAVVASGCYSKRIYELEARADEHDWRLASLHDSLATVSAGAAHLDSLVGDKSAPLRSTGARMESRMDDIETRIEMLESLLKETRYKMSQMSMGGPRSSVAPDTTAMAPDTTEAPSGVAQSIYENAYVDFVKADYQSAISGFRDFVSRFPANDFSDDAQFMVGQAFYALGDPAGAIAEFRRVLDRYPSGDRVPQAMYSLGLSYLKVGDEETAREYFKILAARYPKAPEAGRATAVLDSLKTRGGQPGGR
jgi:tol-pal system protein YbgF